MKVAILYRSNSENERSVLEFEHEYSRRTGRSLWMMDVNSRDGAAMASLYDVMSYPCVLALSEDGQVQQVWQGEHLPLMNEVMYYDQQASFALSSSFV